MTETYRYWIQVQ